MEDGWTRMVGECTGLALDRDWAGLTSRQVLRMLERCAVEHEDCVGCCAKRKCVRKWDVFVNRRFSRVDGGEAVRIEYVGRFRRTGGQPNGHAKAKKQE